MDSNDVGDPTALASKRRKLDAEKLQVLRQIQLSDNNDGESREVVSITLSDGTVVTQQDRMVAVLSDLVAGHKEKSELLAAKNMFARFVGTKSKKSQQFLSKNITTLEDAQRLLEEIKGRIRNARRNRDGAGGAGDSNSFSPLQCYKDMLERSGDGTESTGMEELGASSRSVHYNNCQKPPRAVEKYELPVSGVKHFLEFVKHGRDFPRTDIKDILGRMGSSDKSGADGKGKRGAQATADSDLSPATDYISYLLTLMPYWQEQMRRDEAGECDGECVPEVGRAHMHKMLVCARDPFQPCAFANVCVAKEIGGADTSLMAFLLPEEYETVMATGRPLKKEGRGICVLCLMLMGTLAWFRNNENSHANVPIRFPFRMKMGCPDGYIDKAFICPQAGCTDGVSVPVRLFCAADFVPCNRDAVVPVLSGGKVVRRKVRVPGFVENDKIFFFERTCTALTKGEALVAPRMFSAATLINTDTEYFLRTFISKRSFLSRVKSGLMGGSLTSLCEAHGCSVEDVVSQAFVDFSQARAAIRHMHLVDSDDGLAAALVGASPLTVFLYLYRGFRRYVDITPPAGGAFSYATHSAFYATLTRANASAELLQLIRNVYLNQVRADVAAGKRNKKLRSITDSVERAMKSMGRSVDAKLSAFVEAHYVVLQWFQSRINAGADVSDAVLTVHPHWEGFLKPVAAPAFQPIDLRRNVPASVLYAKPSPAENCAAVLSSNPWDVLARWCPSTPVVQRPGHLCELVFQEFSKALESMAAQPQEAKRALLERPALHLPHWAPRRLLDKLARATRSCDVTLLMLVRVNEVMGLLRVFGQAVVDAEAEAAQGRRGEGGCAVDDAVAEAWQLEPAMREEVELLYSRQQSHRRAGAAGRSKCRAGEDGVAVVAKSERGAVTPTARALTAKIQRLKEICYELRMHAQTHMALALCALEAPDVSDEWMTTAPRDTEPAPLLRVYPSLMAFSGEDEALDISHDIVNIKFVLDNQQRGDFHDTLRKTLPGVCYGRDFLKKLAALLKKNASYREWAFVCLRNSVMGNYRAAARWPGFEGMLRVHAWVDAARDTDALLRFMSSEDKINVVMNVLREQTVFAVERNLAFDLKLRTSFSGWPHFKRKVRAIMDTVRSYYARYLTFEAVAYRAPGVNAIIAGTFESDPKKDVFRSNTGTFRAYILRRFRVLHSYGKYESESARHNEAVPLAERRTFSLPQASRDVIDHYVSCMKPGGVIQTRGLIPIGLSVDGAQKLIAMIKMFHMREPDVEIHKVMYTLSRTDYEMLHYFFDALDLHFSVTAIPVPRDIAHAQEMAVRDRYQLDLDEPSTPPMKTIALIPPHGRVVSHTSDGGGFGSIGNVRVFYDLEKRRYFQDKKETASKGKPRRGGCSLQHELGVELLPDADAQDAPQPASRQKLNKKFLEPCAKTPVLMVYVKDNIVQFTPGQASYTRCPKCGHIFQFSIGKYGVNGLSCGVCDHFQLSAFSVPYCHSCLHTPKEGYRLTSWVAVDDLAGTYDLVRVNTCVDCTKNVQAGSRDLACVRTSAILNRTNQCGMLSLLRSRAGKQYASLPTRGTYRIRT